MKNIIAVIPSAGPPQNQLFPGLYDPMIPINGKPTIDYIIYNLSSLGIKKCIVIINENDYKSFKYLSYRKSTIDLVIIKAKTKSLSESIDIISDHVVDSEILIHLGDGIYNGPLDFSSNCIIVQNKKVLNPEKWCFINNKNQFINNPKILLPDYRLIIGLYYIKNSKDFLMLLGNQSFYNALSKYAQTNVLNFQEIKEGYYDLGHLDEYYKSKIDFLRVRSFNTLEYDSFRGIITKKSTNNRKILQEINWFRNLPDYLKIFTPRLVDYSTEVNIYYSLEFYGYNSMADIFLCGSYSVGFLRNLLDRIVTYLSFVKSNYHNQNFSINNLEIMYFDKTYLRLDELLKNDIMSNLYKKNSIFINGKRYKNIHSFINKERLKNIIEKDIINNEDITIIHGDLCFSNILFDINNGIFKFIDPRGEFGEIGIWGDLKYDIAKIRHSIHGNYESIIADLYDLRYSIESDTFSFSYFNGVDIGIIEYFDNKISELGYNVNVIKFIEALLYLTMIPLHSDSSDRQVIMYLTAVILFNETEELG